ncbi:uncharacterized protein LOC113506629 [Trichoplusia ni]|uniref:Uncharacterized protein LOC113506629 n=1 Tax=Trichoplusia ni TaxID=7111 RepID=A0A7E5WYK2_TRINI|nr:uncharacterized protein LOC113506629 [Trichoplusia ni]
MVVTRSQSDLAELEEQRRALERRDEELLVSVRRREAERIERERLRRVSLNPPASPQAESMTGPTTTTHVATAGPSSERRPTRSPPRSVRSTTSATTRLRLAELEAAEKLANIRRKELELEADLVKKRLAAEVSVIQDDQESIHDPMQEECQQYRVDQWLRTNPLESRGEGGRDTETREERMQQRSDAPRRRSPTPTKARNSIEQLAATLEKMARPRIRHTDLPTFSGAVSEWLPFKAAYYDTTKMYCVSPSENLQRLRSCLKGEAREAVAALLHAATEPDTIIKTLEQCFGRPEVIIDKALEEMKKMPKPSASASDLNSFAIKVQNTICVLNTIDRRGYLYNPLLTREILEKLSPHLRSRWCDFACDNEGAAEPEVVLLSRFLMREADRALRYTYAPPTSTAPATARKETRPAVTWKKKTNAVYSTSEEDYQCPCCRQTHVLTQCPKYKAMNVNQRWEIVKLHKICFKCAQRKHRRINCKARSCGVDQCRRPHHVTLHQERAESPEDKSVTQRTPTEPADKEAVMSVATRTATGPKTVMLKMCPVVIAGPRGEVKTLALFDEGATVTLIDEDLATSIGAEGSMLPLRIQGVNMSSQEQKSRIVEVRVKGVRKDSASHKLHARTMKNLKLHRQSIPDTVLEYEHLRDLPKNEVCYELTRPGLLVGTDHWECIVSRELRVGGPNQPAASRTQLGWVIHGTAPRKAITVNQDNVLHIVDYDQQLHDLVEAHFKIEALGVKQEPRVRETDQRATAIVKKTIKKIDGGYEVGLPWKYDDVTMPPSYNAALRRLKAIEKKMDAAPDFAEQYSTQINNLLEKGYAVPCDGTVVRSAVCWYLPHFAVKNPNKPGKQRLVFDAAARSHGVCLNDRLLEGPDLLLSLPGIIYRFREKAIAVTADIQEMFLRIKIRPEDQPAQQFLWRGDNRTEPPRRYKMTSMIFGAASSPYMAHYVRDYNADMHKIEYPRALDAIKRSHYMDDLVISYDTAEEATKAIEEIRKVHVVAGFTLRGWSASDATVLTDVPQELRAATPTQLGGEGTTNKILGLYWCAARDELGFNTAMNRVPSAVRDRIRAPTKREALSAVMSIYDPLGLLSHYTVRAKIVLQSLWRLQITWDEPIPEGENELFAAWLAQLGTIAQIRLPRCYAPRKYEDLELHVLCDASEQAYATVAYWRHENCNGTVSVMIVAAKAKVAPKRTQTIPRLELQAAVIGARLADTIRKEHRIRITRTVYWTDSSTVVHWIQNDARRYTPFVAHRLGEISELTAKEEWRWLPTDLNVADDATRLTNAPICATDRWFRGPGFLHLPEEQWPQKGPCDEEQDQEVLHITDGPTTESWLPDPARFSKYETLVRATARVLAFTDIC